MFLCFIYVLYLSVLSIFPFFCYKSSISNESGYFGMKFIHYGDFSRNLETNISNLKATFHGPPAHPVNSIHKQHQNVLPEKTWFSEASNFESFFVINI